MISRFVLAAAALLLMRACSPSETADNAAIEVTRTRGEPAATAEIAATAEAPEDYAGMDTRVPPPVPSPFPTVTSAALASATTGAVTIMEPTFFPANDERIRYIGRFDFRNPQEPAFDWSGSAVEVVFSGTGLSLLLADGRNQYNVVVDGHSRVLVTEMGRERYKIAEDLESGRHRVRFSKRTEAYVGAAVFKGLEVIGGGLEEPLPGENRRIEFIGDSITTAYGNEGDSPDCWFTTATQNADKSYAAITADALEAEYTLIALSGLGVIRNLRAETAVSAETAVDYIDRALGLNPFVVWPADQGTPDAVVINLGTNDYSSDPFPAGEEFITTYVELLQAVRARYPRAIIFAMAGPLMLEPAPRLIESAVNQARKAYDDDRLHYVLIEDNLEHSAADLGCDGHPNVSGHEKIAAQLTPVIARELGW